MLSTNLLLVVASVFLVSGLFVTGLALTQRRRSSRLGKARELFTLRREWLEADFLRKASESGKPRGLDWVDCDFENEVTFARDRTSGQLRALVGVTIRFEAIAGGGMEHVEAVSNLRSATAVFLFVDGKWETDGRAVFNLDPFETIRHFQHELERV